MKIGILFDLDGTLLDTLEDLYASINHVLSKLGYPQRTREEVRSFVGNGARRLMEQAIPEGANVDEALEAFLTHYNAACNGATCPYPGIPEALKKLAEKYPLAVVSNKPDSAVKPLCEHHFPGLIALGFTEGCPRKPAPDMVYKVLKEMGADTCVYVGDSEVDVLTAKNAGVPCLSVLWGFRDKEEIEEAGGKVFCNDPTEMPAILEDMIKALQS